MGTQAGIDVYVDGTGAVTGARTVTRSFDDIISSASRTVGSVKDITSALMNVAGNVAGLYSVANAIRKIGEYAQESLKYLALIETSTLGIAASFLVSGQYIDKTTGLALKGASALKAAQSESANVIDQLRVANMQTIATLDQLIVAYQTTLPVAMSKGFNKQMVMDFTLSMVQAAAAIGLPFNQMAEETRSLLLGTINPRNSRIATVLGLRNEDINQYKGDTKGLFDFLTDRLEGFRIAGLESQKTWNGLWSNFKDIAQMGSGMAFAPMFDQIKEMLTSVMHGLVTIDSESKKIVWNSEFLDFAMSASEFLRKTWIALGGAAESVKNIFITLEPILKPVWWVVKNIFEGWGLLASSVLPVFTEELVSVASLVEQSGVLAMNFGLTMMDAVGMVGSALASVGKAAIQALSGDFDAAGETLKNMFTGTFAERFQNDIKKIGENVRGVTKAWTDMQDPMGRMLDRADKYLNKSVKSRPTDDSTYKANLQKSEGSNIDNGAYLRELEKWREADRAIRNAYDKDILADAKASADLQLALLKDQYAQGLLLTKQYLDITHSIKTEMSNIEIFQLEKSAMTAQQAYETAVNSVPAKPKEVSDADIVNIYNNAEMVVKKAQKEMIEAWTKVYEAERKAGVEGLNYSAALTKSYTDQYLALQKVSEELSAMSATNAQRAASMVGINPKTGGLDTPEDRTKNALAIQEQAHNRELEMIKEKEEAAVKSWMTQEKSIENNKKVLGTLANLETQRSLAQKDNINKVNKITDDSYKSQLALASTYTGMAGDMFSALAGTIDQSSRSGFESAKALNLAAAVVSTAAAIMNQMAGGDPYTAWARAAMAGAMGAIQIAKIASTSFGGGGSVSAPPGSFTAAGASAGNAGLGNLAVPLTSIQDSQTTESLARLTDSTDNAALVIGRLSKSIDTLTALFEQGGAGYALATNAPGQSTAVVDAPTVASKMGKDWKQIMRGFTDIGQLFDNISPATLISSAGDVLFGGSRSTTAAGISLGFSGGQAIGRNFTTTTEDGGLFGDNSSWNDYLNNPELQTYISALIKPYVGDIVRMAATLGTTVDISQYQSKITNIATAGRKPEDIAKDLQAWMTTTLQGISLTVDGLEDNVGSYDDAYIMLKRYNDALVSTNDSLELISAATLQGSFANAKYADSLQQLMGGTEEFTSKIDNYFSKMFTEEEQTALQAAQATRRVNAAFAEMQLNVPATAKGFRSLVDAQDLTTESGQRTFDALMNIVDAFDLTQQAVVKTQKVLNESAETILDTAINAANALRDISVGPLSTGSPESIYFERQAAFATALANGRAAEIPELGKALLESSRQYNASGAGYLTDYRNVEKALADIAGMRGEDRTLSAAEKQVQLLTDIKKGFEDGNYAMVASVANGLTTGLLKGSEVSNAVNSSLTTAGVAIYDYSADYAIALKMAVGMVAADLKYDLDKSGGVDIRDARGYLRLSQGLPAFANGGITSGLSFAGEAGPEAVIPLPDGRQVPVMMTGSADNRELIAEIRELRKEVAELKTHAAANVRATVAAGEGTIEAVKEGNVNSKVLAQKAALRQAA